MTHTQAYIICSLSRSGTTLLCDMLSETGAAGKPDSFFRLQSMQSYWAPALGVNAAAWPAPTAFDKNYLDAVIREGIGSTETFGMRLMWDQVANLCVQLATFHPNLPNNKARIEATFGKTTFIHLSRKDKLAQAISRIRAEQTGLWHVNADGSDRERVKSNAPAIYDDTYIATQIAEYEAGDAAWRQWFEAEKIDPVLLSYEQLAESPNASLQLILNRLGIDPAVANHVEPKTKKLSDELTMLWREKFQRR